MSSEDSSTPRPTWALDEFADLATAWELALARPRDNSVETLHDAVFKHFVALRGGSTRRNKAALTSKRSVLKFSYLFIRDFDQEQAPRKKEPPFFECSVPKRTELLSNWKKTNSSIVEITPVMYQMLGRIVSKATARSTSNPWSMEEMMQLVRAWGIAARILCDSKSDEPMSIVHEMYRQFEILQQGKNVRNLSGLATRRRVLKQSYSRISAFDKIQEMDGKPKFTDLPVTTRHNLIRSWKNANLLDLPPDMYAELHDVIFMDTRAVALEDMRRAQAAGAKGPNSAGGRSGRGPGRPSKKQKVDKLSQESKDDDEETGSTFSSRPPSTVGDSEEEKAALPRMVAQSRTILSKEKAVDKMATTKQAAVDTQQSGDSTIPRQGPVQRPSLVEVVAAGQDRFAEKSPAISSSTQGRVTQKALAPKPSIKPSPSLPAQPRRDQIDRPNVALVANTHASNSPSVVKRKRKIQPDGPNGHLWENAELQILINAWEKAANIVINSDPAERLSLNKEMYREFVDMQGGSSIRNITALAARRSSLKFSYVHIHSFNESQKAKGAPSYHNIPEGSRMSLLRSWKNRNSVDLTKEMYDGLERILGMDQKLAEFRSLRPPPLPKTKKKVKVPQDPKDLKESKSKNDPSHVSKTAKWTTEESSDLIKACADVKDAPPEMDQSPEERESLIYDAFVARRQNAGDTDIPIHRDLRTMAQQWRYILASYSYIKACNDSRSESDSPSWFEMSPMQKRAYQQCTNVPLKFVDLDADMFELVFKTSFDSVATSVPASTPTPALPAPVAKPSSDGISLRPRSTRKKTEAFWSSDSESSVTSMPLGVGKHSKKEFTGVSGKKGNNWPVKEIWNLIQAWEEASAATNSNKLTSALDKTYSLFMEAEAASNRNRSLNSVRNKMIALKSSFTNISTFISERGDNSVWFGMTAEQRFAEIRTWNNKTIMDLNKEMFDALARILTRNNNGTIEKPEKRKPGRPPKSSPTHSDTNDSKEQDEKSHVGQKPEKYVAAHWTKKELLLLAEACGELLEGRRSRRYVFEEEKDRFFSTYEQLGGNNSLAGAVGLARFVLDSYEFVYFYNEKAQEKNCISWFELDPADRDPIIKRMSKAYRSFNGLNTVDQEIFDVIDGIDADIRTKLGETKKKTYKPPNDASSSRYVDIEAVVNRCVFKKRKSSVSNKPTPHETQAQLQEESSDADSSSPESSSEDESGSDSSAPRGIKYRPVPGYAPTPSPRRNIIRRGSETIHPLVSTTYRKRTRDADSSTLVITEIIQKQNRKLEEAVKRFRKDSADARKEHHNFLLRKIQDSFPVDNGNGSFLERVAERQGQTLVDIFQRLQEQRDTEKAKDDALMRELFGRT
ncbi:hypothetical protein PHMEG_00017137 [Phytophthora megakarya]|uniref:Uncharacterized protein n=1 Tax=Phytophthora megakarya TaxID=4795 RepID=A0A225VZ49_9STRA|nr:hypothetical protein PHMEG_00017137 [Phytophthora megakarya]